MCNGKINEGLRNVGISEERVSENCIESLKLTGVQGEILIRVEAECYVGVRAVHRESDVADNRDVKIVNGELNATIICR